MLINHSDGLDGTFNEMDDSPAFMRYLENYSSLEMAERFARGVYPSLRHVAYLVGKIPGNPTFEEYCQRKG